jgi:hypothetical protein
LKAKHGQQKSTKRKAGGAKNEHKTTKHQVKHQVKVERTGVHVVHHSSVPF